MAKGNYYGFNLWYTQGIAIIKSDTGQLTPFSFACNLVNGDGASRQDPIIVGTTLLYIDSTLKRIKTLNYAYETNSYTSTNLNNLCPELIQSNIKKIVYQDDEKDLIYVLLEDGSLYYLLYSSVEMFYSWGKIKTYSKIKHIEALEKYTSGTNLFIIDDDNNILRKSEEIIFRSKDDYLTEARNEEELHNLYYDYLFKEINNMNYLDFSREVYYHSNELLTFLREEETDQGIYGVLTSTNPFSYSRDELVTMRIMDRDRNIEFEIQEQIDDKTLKVLLLTYMNHIPESYSFNNWSFNKNILDGFDNTIYRDDTNFTIVGDGFSYEHIEIKDGKIQLPIGIYIGHFRIGYNYNALIKTMALGGQVDSFNTIIAKKNILKVFFGYITVGAVNMELIIIT